MEWRVNGWAFEEVSWTGFQFGKAVSDARDLKSLNIAYNSRFQGTGQHEIVVVVILG